MNVSTKLTTNFPSYACRSQNTGPDAVTDEFDNSHSRFHDSGPDAVYDEFSSCRGGDTYSSYDSWSSSYDSGTTYGAMF